MLVDAVEQWHIATGGVSAVMESSAKPATAFRKHLHNKTKIYVMIPYRHLLIRYDTETSRAIEVHRPAQA